MYIDIPVLKRCCFCLPLRPGLLIWTYIKTIFNILMVGFLAHFLSFCIADIKYTVAPVVILSVLTVFIILDTIVGIAFIIGAHKKYHNLIKIYYKFCLAIFFLLILSIIGLLILICVRIGFLASIEADGYKIADVVLASIGPAIGLCFLAILYIYMILLVRSEVLKLENNIQCKFVKTSTCADDAERKTEVEKAVYNRLTSDPGSV